MGIIINVLYKLFKVTSIGLVSDNEKVEFLDSHFVSIVRVCPNSGARKLCLQCSCPVSHWLRGTWGTPDSRAKWAKPQEHSSSPPKKVFGVSCWKQGHTEAREGPHRHGSQSTNSSHYMEKNLTSHKTQY